MSFNFIRIQTALLDGVQFITIFNDIYQNIFPKKMLENEYCDKLHKSFCAKLFLLHFSVFSCYADHQMSRDILPLTEELSSRDEKQQSNKQVFLALAM